VEALPDGSYDVMIVDVEVGADQQPRIDVVVTAGSHRGDVVSLRASAMSSDPLGLMGLPACLRVSDGTPSLEMD
jgi:hypothetical protein